MSDLAKKRIQKEINNFLKCDSTSSGNIKLEVKDDNILTLRGEIPGPPDTVYESGTFVLDITIPEKYPHHPPVMKFETKIWHPNISSVTGAICLDLLKTAWAASLTLNTLLISLQTLLADPVPDDPQDAVVAQQYLKKRKTFERTARHWTNVYAGGRKKVPKLEKKLKQLKKMKGTDYNEHIARVALSNVDWNFDKAVESLQ